jgi:hypothetical protein
MSDPSFAEFPTPHHSVRTSSQAGLALGFALGIQIPPLVALTALAGIYRWRAPEAQQRSPNGGAPWLTTAVSGPHDSTRFAFHADYGSDYRLNRNREKIVGGKEAVKYVQVFSLLTRARGNPLPFRGVRLGSVF